MITPRLLTLQDLFGDRVQYGVPIYQRPYVWGQEEQWEPLWEDIHDLAERRLSTDSGPQAHFLGAIVIELTSADPGRVKTYTVIDGQQRLTTLQLVLAALRRVASRRDPSRVTDIDRLLRNEGRHTDGDLKFKLLLSRHDRTTFQDSVSLHNGLPPHGDQGIPGALNFFARQLDDWVGDDDAEAGLRFDALQDTLDGLLQVVAIQLDGSADAQVIFETLNSRGADLTSLDLVKNALLRQARRDGADDADLHAEFWEPAFGDADYWFEEVRQGRYTRERADLFLMHWLTMKTARVPAVQHLFADFRKSFLTSSDQPAAKDIIAEICDDGEKYRSFESLDPRSPDGRFFRRLDQMDTTTLLPVALLLFSANELIADRRQRALLALESWLVRRMLLGATTAHYNRLLTELLNTLRQAPTLSAADDIIIDELRGFANPTDRWPEDADIEERLMTQPVYGRINVRRIRMLLEACEECVADSARTEQIAIPPGLSVEHALPQTWTTNWLPEPQGCEEADADAAAKREAHVHLLGNLTLVTRSLNAALSNAPWAIKRLELAARSQLLINQRLCASTTWDEATIDTRTREFARHIITTWPGPSASW